MSRIQIYYFYIGFPWWLSGDESDCNEGDMGSNPRSGRFPGEWYGNAHQYSGLENPMDTGNWWATVHEIARVGHS